MLVRSCRAAAALLRRPLSLLLLPAGLLLVGGAAMPQALQIPREQLRQQPALQDVLIRVLLQQGERLRVGASLGPLQISDARGSLLMELSPGDELRFTVGGSGLSLERRGSQTSALNTGLREVWITPSADAGAEAQLLLAKRAYRGRVQVRLDGGQLHAINHIPLETYLASVVGSEMPATWPQAALKAQAVAARTYALAKRRPSAPFDVKATVASQVYRGIEGETDSTREAVASTRGQVLLYRNTLIEAVFHSSSSSGRTESSGEIWSQQLPYLVSVPDFDNASPVHLWRARFEPDELRRLFQETGGVQRIDVVTVSDSGRIRRVRIIGPLGSMLLSGAELRQRLGLRSTLVQLELIGGQPLATATATAMPPAAATAGAADRGSAMVSSAQANAAAGSLPLAARPTGPAPAAGSDAWGPLPPALPPLPGFSAGPSAAAANLRHDPPALVVQGKGFGHGVGLSQWGAYGMALQGKDYEQILRHYYRGAELKPFRASTF